MENTLKWFETEYCDRADETIQPMLVNDTMLYTLFDRRGYNYVFETIYAIHLFLSGFSDTYVFTCETEEELVEYLENLGKI